MPPRELTDDYRLEKILSSSRGGSILRASRIDNGQTVVIKLINVPAAADPAVALKAAARFSAYAAGLAGLRHPNLPLVLDSGLTPDGGAFLVMEKLDGVGFEAGWAPGGGAVPDRILPLLAQALAGLEELARHGLAHLNLCPENLFLVPAAAATTTALAPATSALDRTGGGAPEQTVKLLGLGTPLFYLGEPWPDASSARFRAPELALPAAARETMPDWHADCYALAQTACCALGITVAVGDLAGTLMHTVQMPLALSFELANDEALRQILERCLRQSPRERPSHGAVRNAFRLALGGIELTGGAASAERHQREPGPRPSPAVSSAGAEATAGASAAPDLAAAAAAGAGAGGDSFLDLFDVPASLPALPGTDESHGAASDPFGLSFPDSLELPQVDDIFASGQDHPGVELPHMDELFASGPHHPAGGGGYFDLGPGADVAPPPAPPRPAGGDQSSRPAGAVEPPRPAGIGGLPRAEGPIPVPAPAAALGVSSLGGPALPAPVVSAAALSFPGVAAAAPKWDVAAPPAEPAAGELLSGVDELLGSLPPPPPLVPPPVAPRAARGRPGGRGRVGAAAAEVQGRRAPTAAAAPRPGAAALAFGRKLLAPLLALPRPVLLAGAAALLLAASVLTWILAAHGSRQAPSAAGEGAVVAAAVPPPRPGRSAAAKFFDARSYLIFGKESDARVRQALRELTYADQGALGPDGCRQLAAIQQTLAASALETVPQDLASGLRSGDLGALESVVEVASDRDLPPRQLGDFARARNLVNQYEPARAAAAAGDHAQVLERFRAMEGLSRTLRDPLELRDRAAQALEDDARALASEGRYDEALRRLGPLLRDWPERAGIKDLARRYETASASEPQQLAILDSVPSYESRRKPSEALDLLRPLQPTPHLEQRFAEAKQRLEAQLAQLDAEPPQVVLRPGYPLDYWRGSMVTLSFRVTDDYEVKSVKVFARPESGRMTELPLQKSGFGWDVKIPPSFHQNGTVELYVVATDRSGHEGYLGSKENPLRLKRRQGFQQLLH
jgi:tetratricopeptide (TPR) repeat protein